MTGSMRESALEEFDYVIVGAGAAGCVLANRLSESGKNTVAVIEAGGQDNHIWIKIPAGFNKTVYNDKLNWGYETAPGPYIDNRRIKYPRGKVLGRLGLDQRPSLRARPGGRLRHVGAARLPRLVVERRAALLQARRIAHRRQRRRARPLRSRSASRTSTIRTRSAMPSWRPTRRPA